MGDGSEYPDDGSVLGHFGTGAEVSRACFGTEMSRVRQSPESEVSGNRKDRVD